MKELSINSNYLKYHVIHKYKKKYFSRKLQRIIIRYQN